jgi:hypothetical protein
MLKDVLIWINLDELICSHSLKIHMDSLKHKMLSIILVQKVLSLCEYMKNAYHTSRNTHTERIYEWRAITRKDTCESILSMKRQDGNYLSLYKHR